MNGSAKGTSAAVQRNTGPSVAAGTPAALPAVTGKLKVFVSYSRDDLDFADQLVSALELYGFEPIIDRQGIAGGEDWQKRLGGLVLEADTVAFVLSPSSAKSEMCAWEVGEAARLNKRILPVVPRPLEGTAAPQRLKDLNYVFFYAEPRSPGSGFGSGLAALVAALKTDLGWIRQQTRLQERATDWIAGNRPASRLLSGSDITEAKTWAANRPKGAPEPTEVQIEFIRASEDEAASRAGAERQRLAEMAAAQDERATALQSKEQALRSRRWWIRSAIAGGFGAAAVLAGVAWTAVQSEKRATLNEQQARLSTAEAQTQRLITETQRALAADSEKKAISQADLARNYLYQSQIVRSRALLEKAADLIVEDKHRDAVLLTIEALDVKRKGLEDNYFYLPEADKMLRMQWLERQFIGHTRQITAIAISPDGARVVTGADDKTVRLWDVKRYGDGWRGYDVPGTVTSVAISADGNRIAAGTGNTIYVWDVRTESRMVLKGHTGIVNSVVLTADGSRVVSGGRDRTARVWNAATGEQLAEHAGHEGAVNSVAVYPDGSRFVSASEDKTARVWDLTSGALLFELKTDDAPAPIWRVAVAPEGSLIVTGSSNGDVSRSSEGDVRIWDAKTGAMLRHLTKRNGIFTCLAVAAGGRIFLCSEDGKVMMWSGAFTEKPIEVTSKQVPTNAVAVTTDGSKVFTSPRRANPETTIQHRGWLWTVAPVAAENLVMTAKQNTPSCLSTSERLRYILGPEPPEWCVTARTPPYQGDRWQNADTPDIGISQAYGNFADGALYTGDFPNALLAAELALRRDPSLTWVEVNLAHAKMFLNRTDEARTLYLKRRGEKLKIGDRERLWDHVVQADFKRLSDSGLYNGLMNEIIEKLEKPPAAKP